MIRKACVMKVFPNCHAEYKKRHAEIWPELVNMLTEFGAHNYSIHLDPVTNSLFAYLEIDEENKWSQSAETDICQKWWAYMKDVMETNPDNSPVIINLEEVFYKA